MSDQAEVGQSLERYVAILDVFAGLRDDEFTALQQNGAKSYGVADVSGVLGISKGTVSRYLRKLESVGLLNRLPDRRYRLSARVYHWGQAAVPGGDVRPLARPVMEALAERFGEPVSLFILESGVAVCIDQVDGIHPVRLNAAIGRRLPLHSGSSPRLLLAFASESQQNAVLESAPFPRLTPATISSAEELRRAMEETRRSGYVVSEGESNVGVIGIAAPIRDANGAVVAAISIAGLEDRLAGSRRDECVAGVRAAADDISRALGYLPHVDGMASASERKA